MSLIFQYLYILIYKYRDKYESRTNGFHVERFWQPPTPIIRPPPVPGMHFHLLRTRHYGLKRHGFSFKRGEQLLRERNN